MAKLIEPFITSKDEKDIGVIPHGDYVVKIVHSSLSEEWLHVEFRIKKSDGDKYTGRQIKATFRLDGKYDSNANNLSKLLFIVGLDKLEDTNELLGRELIIEWGPSDAEDSDFVKKSVVKDYKRLKPVVARITL